MTVSSTCYGISSSSVRIELASLSTLASGPRSLKSMQSVNTNDGEALSTEVTSEVVESESRSQSRLLVDKVVMEAISTSPKFSRYRMFVALIAGRVKVEYIENWKFWEG